MCLYDFSLPLLGAVTVCVSVCCVTDCVCVCCVFLDPERARVCVCVCRFEASCQVAQSSVDASVTQLTLSRQWAVARAVR